MRIVLRENGAERVIGELAHWPPIARIMAHTPRQTRPVMLADVVAALLRLAVGDGEPWAGVVSQLRAAKLLRPRDPSLSEFCSLSLETSLVSG